VVNLLLTVSRTLSMTTSREELARALPSLVGAVVAFDAVALSFESHAGVESEAAPFACRLPLVLGNLEIGTLVVTRGRQPFTSEERDLLTLIADQVAAALARQGARERLTRAELVLSVNNTVAANLEPQPLLRSIVQVLRQTLECDFVVISIADLQAGHMIALALDFPESRGAFREGARLPIEGSVVGQVFRSRKRRLVSDLNELDPILHARAAAEGIAEGCFCPLVHQDRGLGVMTAGWRQRGHFSESIGQTLDAVAAQVAIALDNAMAYQKISELKDQLAQEKLYLEDEIRGEMNFNEIVGNSAALRRVLKQVETVAPTDSSVIIYGETGSGKELIARAIHDLSARRSGTFVKLNCAAIPTGLLESELFGHERGAFTGAVAQRIGRFELANRGTIFLDEIGEIPLELQPKLLRVLQEREFERLGSSRTLRSDARLIAATNRDLSAMVERQAFRADLYYRLNVFPIHLPPLRERGEDIPLLVRHFVQQFARQMNRNIETITAESMDALKRYPWPGNIRELQNLIERAVILSPGSVLRVPLEELKARLRAASDAAPRQETKQTLADAERAHILAVLKESDWILAGANGAAARLGMNRSTLRFRMKKLGIARSTSAG
jgi:formate hydrogenlyase transcriptional activator